MPVAISLFIIGAESDYTLVNSFSYLFRYFKKGVLRLG